MSTAGGRHRTPSNDHKCCQLILLACKMRLVPAVSLLTVASVCSFIVACPAAGIIRPRPKGASAANDRNDSRRSSISHDQETLHRPSLSTVGSVDKRGTDPGLELVFFERKDLFIPLQAAAEALEVLYTGIATNSRGPWANYAPRTWIRMTTGTIGLLMTATEGTTVPWAFVTWFALQMLRYTELGYTGMYTANYVNPTVGNAIWVSLYQCSIGPLTDPAGIGTPAKVASCLNANAQAWFPTRGAPTR